MADSIKDEIKVVVEGIDTLSSKIRGLDDVTDVTSNRIGVLIKSLADVEDRYQSGKISLEQYTRVAADLDHRIANLSQGLDEDAKEVKKVTEVVVSGSEDIKRVTEEAKTVVGEYSASFEKMGSTANTALGILSAGLRSVNPGISSMLGMVQKLIPNLTELGNAAKKTGSLMKAMTSGAGIMTLITLITTLITNWEELSKTIGVSEDAVKRFKDTTGKAFDFILRKVVGVGNVIKDFGSTFGKSFIKLIKGDFSGAIDVVKSYSVKESFSVGEYSAQAWIDGIRAKRLAKELESVIKAEMDRVEEILSGSAKHLLDKAFKEFSESEALLTKYFKAGKISVQEYNEALETLRVKLEDARRAYDPLVAVLSIFDETVLESVDNLPEVIDEIVSSINFDIDSLNSSIKDNSKVLSEWVNLGISSLDKELSMIDIKAQAFLDANIAEVDVVEWAESEKKKIRDRYADQELSKVKEVELKKKESIVKGITAVSTVLKSVQTAINDNLQAELNAGKITEKQYEEKKEALKAVSVAQVVAETVVGMQGAYSSLASIPYVGPALGAAASAAVLASGIAGIASINSESLSSSSSSVVSADVVNNPSQVYVQNDSYKDIISAIDSNTSAVRDGNQTQTVLVLDDFNKVKSNQSVVKTVSTF